MAGHETTAQALSWTFYLLSQHPDVERKLHDELVTVLAGRTPRYEDLAQLRYTRMVIEESMRLFPPAHIISRQPVADDEVLGHRIPAGSEVMILPWLLHRKPALWENPDASIQSVLRPSARRGVRVLPTSRLAPARAFASVPRSPWPKR
jgi:enediyne biosynthesis protein E7